MLNLLAEFVLELRRIGLPVSLTEHLDAAEAIHHLELEDRDVLKFCLASTLVKSDSHFEAFESVFEIYFGGRVQRSLVSSFDGKRSDQDFLSLVEQALLDDDQVKLDQLARLAVDRYAGFEPGRPVGGSYYLYRTLRSLGLEELSGRLLGQVLDDTTRTSTRYNLSTESFLDERLASDEFNVRIRKLRDAIEDEVRRRLIQDRGIQSLAQSTRKTLPEDIEIMRATREDIAVLQRFLVPLARKLSARLAQRRRLGRRGPLDIRATVRRSLSTGGALIEPRFRSPRPSKPEIFVIADVSGSVASFARFTLHLVAAISTQFSKVRSFAFVDGIVEVTPFFEEEDDPAYAVRRINSEADVVWVDGHSNYGHALAIFDQQWGKDITGRSSVLILGDARNNYHASESWVLKEIQRKARHVYWLNPEPRDYWGSGDSIVQEYAKYCDDVIECRTVGQLEEFVGSLG